MPKVLRHQFQPRWARTGVWLWTVGTPHANLYRP